MSAHEERIKNLEDAVFGDGKKDDPGLVPRVVSLERDRNLARWGIAGVIAFVVAVVENWLGNLKAPWQH